MQDSDNIMVKRFAVKTTLVVAAFCTVFAAGGKAQCGFSMNPRTGAAVPDAITARPPAPAAQTAPATKDGEKPRASDNAFSIVGLWNVNFIAGGQTVDQGFDQWNSDGTEILNDTPPPSTGNVCLGVWTKTGPLTYKLKHPSWTFDAAGNLNGTAVIRETVTLGAGADSFQGPASIDIYDLTGKNLMHLDATVTGTRITVD